MDKPIFALPYNSLPNEIRNHDYHRAEVYKPFVSSSILKNLLVSPKWLKYCMEHPEDSRTISLENELKGSVYHDILCSMVNRGDELGFLDSWQVFEAPVNARTGKQYGYDSQAFISAFESFKLLHPEKETCSQAEIDLAREMIKELRYGNPHLSRIIRHIMKHGQAETSHFCEYLGGYFKYRTDLETKDEIFDWKTTIHKGPKAENWSKQVIKMGYHISGAFYQFFDAIIYGKWRKFYWIAQEKEPPYDFNIIDAENWTWKIELDDDGSQMPIPMIGGQLFLKLLDQYIFCLEHDVWPGYSIFTQPNFRGQRIATAQVPGYELNNMLTFYNEE